MTIKKVLKYGTPSLRQPSKEVHKVSKKIKDLVKDLLETMYAQNGVGLAAPQIGENYRIFVIDVSSGDEPLNPMVFINPKIIKKSGAFISSEGCLSFPEVFTEVRRYKNVTIKAQDSKGRSFVLNADGGTLLTRAIQHEYDHLDGVLFIDHARDIDDANEKLSKYNLPAVEEDRLINEDKLEEEIQKNQTKDKEENND
ncbi:MAG: peptide deformylase [Candidatus Melainabacteria bacterium]|nr:MAG: peptide deformylase [Candidatus Melainabacteria bacterium]